MDLPKNRLLAGLLGRVNNTRPCLISVLDPGTEYVKALVVQIEGERAAVLGQGVVRHEEPPFERGVRAVELRLSKACDAALREAEDMTESTCGHKLVPDHVVMAFPPQWIRQGAFSVQGRRASSIAEITPREVEAAVLRAERLALQQLAEELGTSRRNLSIVGSAITEIKVGSHAVTDPVGFRGESLSLTLFNAAAQVQHVAVLERLALQLELELIDLVSEERALADCLPVEEAIVVNLGSQFTSLSWVRAGCPIKMMTIPFGGRKLSERLMHTFNLAPAKAEALKLRYSLGKLDKEGAEAVAPAILPGVAEWLARIEAGLATMAGKALLPPFIYLSGGGSSLDELVQGARRFPWLQHLNFVRYPEIHLFGPSEVPGVYNRTGHVGGREMAVAVALARWVIPRKRPGEHLIEMLDRAIRKHAGMYSGG